METKTLSQKAISALEQGGKIEAIKIARVENNLGLKEAKELVEDFLEKNPVTNDRLKENSSGGFGFIIIVVIAIAIAAYYSNCGQ